MASAAKGAEPLLYLATSPEVEGVSGKLFESITAKQMPPELYDAAAVERLEKSSRELTILKE